MYPSSKVGKNEDVIRENGAVDTDAILFLDGNGMDTNSLEI